MATDGEIRWYSPDPRGVLPLNEVHIPRRLARVARQGRFRIAIDTAFGDVIRACAAEDRDPEDAGTWIDEQIIESYTALHDQGLAHSVEAWSGERLVGGLYGLSLGATFFGESMFALEKDASKLSFVALVRQLGRWGIPLVDCQVYTPHLAHFGAREWPRRDFLEALRSALDRPTRLGPWQFESE